MPGLRFFVFLVAGALAQPTRACVCPGAPSLDAATLGSASAVFEGRVVAKRVSMEWQYEQFVPIVTSTFAVRRLWKGNHISHVELREGSGSCAGRFSGDASYRVVADGYDPVTGRLSASACSPTYLVRSSDTGLIAKVLGQPVAEFLSVPESTVGPAAKFWYWTRAYFVSGLCVIANLVVHAVEADPFGNKWDSPPGHIWPRHIAWICVAIAGIGAIGLIVLVGAAVARLRRRRPALVFVSAALLWAAALVMTAGYVYAEHTSAAYALAWQQVERPAAPPPPTPPDISPHDES